MTVFSLSISPSLCLPIQESGILLDNEGGRGGDMDQKEKECCLHGCAWLSQHDFSRTLSVQRGEWDDDSDPHQVTNTHTSKKTLFL